MGSFFHSVGSFFHGWGFFSHGGPPSPPLDRLLKKKRSLSLLTDCVLAERTGFEPANQFCRLHAFQACLFNHSSTFPKGLVVKIGCKDKGKKQAGTIFGQEFYRSVRIALTLAVGFAPTDPRLGAGGTQPRPHLREAQPARRRHHFCHRTAGVVTGCRTRGAKGSKRKARIIYH